MLGWQIKKLATCPKTIYFALFKGKLMLAIAIVMPITFVAFMIIMVSALIMMTFIFAITVIITSIVATTKASNQTTH
jgi:hypothetical protein